MTYDPAKHHRPFDSGPAARAQGRRSIRLEGYDYAQPGAYFVTIVTQGRECLFGDVVDGEMRLNDAGRMVERWWAELGNKYSHVVPDAHVVMPNHFHGIVVITDGGDGVGADLRVCPNAGAHVGAPLPIDAGAHVAPLSEIVQWFKTMTTNEYIRGVKILGWIPFPGKLWQRNYYEHIVRDENALDRIRQYIANNPAQWDADDENPGKAAR